MDRQLILIAFLFAGIFFLTLMVFPTKGIASLAACTGGVMVGMFVYVALRLDCLTGLILPAKSTRFKSAISR